MLRLTVVIAFGFLLFTNTEARTFTANGLRTIADVIEPDQSTPQWKKTIKDLIGD